MTPIPTPHLHPGNAPGSPAVVGGPVNPAHAHAQDGSARSDAPPLRLDERHDARPLSPAQERLWFLEQFEPGTTAYVVPVCTWIDGPLRIEDLRRALTGVAARHEILRARFQVTAAGQPFQLVAPEPVLAFTVRDAGAADAGRHDDAALSLATTAAALPFDLGNGPLWRALVVGLGDQRHLLMLAFHHLIVDDRSLPILVGEIAELYQTAPSLRPAAAAVQYDAFTSWHRDWLAQGDGAAQLTYWTRQLAELPPFDLPTDRPRPRVPSTRGARLERAIPDRLVAALTERSAALAITRSSFLLASLGALLHRWTGATDIPIAIPIDNREDARFDRLVGMCINTAVIRITCRDDEPWTSLAQRVQAVVDEAHRNARLPFDRVVQALRSKHDDASAGPASVMCDSSDDADPPDLALAGTTCRPVHLDLGSTTFDLVFSIRMQDTGSWCAIRYATDLFDQATIERMLGHVLVLLESIVSEPGRQLHALQLLTAAEYRQVTVDWNATATPFPRDACLHHLFEAQVARTPESIALIDGEARITYRELNQRANRLARRLGALGAGPEQLVGIFLNRSHDLIVAIIAVLKAGSGYVPFDRKMTHERVAYMAGDAQVRLVVCEAEHAGLFPAGTTTVVPRRDREAIAALPDSDRDGGARAGNVAYVIYTSGSTGTPKGVVIEHRSAVNAVLATIERYRFLAVDRTLFQSSVTFDSSVSKIFQSICNGGTLIVAPEDADFDLVLDLTARHGIPRLTTTPSELAVLNDMPERMHAGIQIIGAAGENLSPSDVDRILDRVPILNIYGPTETTISTTSFRLTKGAFTAAGTVPIGKPIMNYQVYVCDRHLQVQPIGCIGELCIGGVGVARGYLGAPEATAAKFVANPFTPGERLYRSGDLARWLPDGNLEFRGRIDQQVKIRGYRIELGEIEFALGRHPEVQQAVVVARQIRPAGTYLTAYVVMSAGARTPVEALREFLGQALPDYMVPARYLRLDEFPRQVSGKIDRKALPEPDWSKRAIARSATPPRTDQEKLLVDIWNQVLGITGVGIHDNFFELGGDSILSLQIVARAHQAGLTISVKQLFQERTIAQLAAVAGSGSATAGQDQFSGEVALTPNQRWFTARAAVHPELWQSGQWFDTSHAIDPGALGRAVNAVISHHDALRLRFERSAGPWRQHVSESGQPVTVVEASVAGHSPDQVRASLDRIAQQLRSRIDLASGRVIQVALIALGGGASTVLVVAHRLVMDGASWRILGEDLETAYRAARAATPCVFPAATLSFARWANRLAAHAATPAASADAAYWLAAVPMAVARLPRDTAADNRVGDARTVVATLDATETAALLGEVSTALRCQPREALLTALVQAIGSWAGEAALLVDCDCPGRAGVFADADVSRTIGWFTAVYPLWLDLRAGSSPDAGLRIVKERLRALPGQGIGYGLLRYLDPSTDLAQRLARQPAAEVAFSYQDQSVPRTPVDAILAPRARPDGSTRHPDEPRSHLLSVSCAVVGGRLSATWTYSQAIHREATVARLAASLTERVRAVIALSRTARPATLTPSDFPLAGLDQARLDKLLALVTKPRPP